MTHVYPLKTIIPLVLLSLVTGPIQAVEEPRPLATDYRIHTVAYQADNVVTVRATPFIVTQIVLGQQEAIETIQSGDLAAWTLSVPKGLPNRLFLKPTVIDSHTNLTVVTNRHTYYFQLDSAPPTRSPHTPYTYAIRFTYPADKTLKRLADWQTRHLTPSPLAKQARYHWDYRFNGDRSIMPQRVFDDGRFTYLQLRPGQPVPALFAVDNANGQEAVVNDRRVGDYLIVQRIAPQLTLRAGPNHVASVFNTRQIRALTTQKVPS